MIHNSIWKYDNLYRLMEQDPRFEPIVVVCPYVLYGEKSMEREMYQACEYSKMKGYRFISTFDESKNEWLDVKREVNPDIVFFTNPHELTREEYYITNYEKDLTCYVPYAFVVIHLLDMHYRQRFHSLLWKAFYETKIHFEFAKRKSYNFAKNVVISGYPGIDKFIDSSYTPSDPWKIKNREVRRIIWAPHHTIDDNKAELSYSTFLHYNRFFLELAEKYRDKIQIAFKPHPILREKLYGHNDWGKERTDDYYSEWLRLPNTQLEIGEYEDLFLTSDALIHDSASFMVEYVYTSKPSAFLIRDEEISKRFNLFGRMVFDHLYKLDSEKEILNFIENVVLTGLDVMKEQRLSFLKSTLLPPNDSFPSKNIFNELKKQLSYNRNRN